jgi:tRNA threonylcarbamoyladenosine biosynthesis protein TsaB
VRLLAFDAALGITSAAVLVNGHVVAERALTGERGCRSNLLAAVAAGVLDESGMAPDALDAIAANVGPGSFTGLRSSLALAWGLAAGAGCRVIAATVREVFAQAMPPVPGRALWVAVESHRAGHVFLAPDGPFRAVAEDEFPDPVGPVTLAGDAAAKVLPFLLARRADVVLMERCQPRAHNVAAVALLRHEGRLPPLAAIPLYVDPPAARRRL